MKKFIVLLLLIALAVGCKGGGKTVPFIAGAGASQPVIPAAWLQANWWFDPANSSGVASDSNTCTTQGAPCLTWGEIFVHRLGGGTPQLQQPTTFHQMSSQTLNVDPIYGTFQLSNGAQAILIGSLTQVCTIALNVATVTAQVRGAPGTRWQVSNPCAGEVAKTLIQDTTANTWATVDSVAGTATISQPLTNASVATVGIPSLAEGSMATNDAFTVWSQPLSNLKAWRVTGGDVGVGGANSAAVTAWIQGIEVADSSGTGASELPMLNDAAVTAYSMVRFDTRVHADLFGGRGAALYMIGCDLGQAFVQFGGAAGSYFGGVFRGTTGIQAGALPTFDGDIALHGAITVAGGALAQFVTVFSDASNILIEAGAELRESSILWGSVPITIDPASSYWNATGSTFAATLLTSGALKFGANTTGFTSPNCGTFTLNGVNAVNVAPAAGHFPAGSTIAWSLNTVGGTPGTGAPFFATTAVIQDQFTVKSPTAGANDVYNWCALPASVTISAANLDLFNGLQNPNTGARFSNTQ